MDKLTPKQQKEGGHGKTPPGYPAKATATTYADPSNKKYPIETAAHVRAANSYISMPKNRQMYSSAELTAMESRIKRAAKKFGIDISG